MSVVLHITRLRNSRVYYPGEEVTGFLVVNGPYQRVETTVQAIVKGLSWVMEGSGQSFVKDTQMFFYTGFVLHQGLLELKKGETRTFPFRIPIATQTEPDGRAHVKYSRKKHIFAQGPHPVPPSIQFSQQGTSTTASIEYVVSAEVKHKFDTLHKEGPVTVVNSPAWANEVREKSTNYQHRRSKVLSHASSQFSGNGGHRRRSMATWISDKMASDTPKAVFSFTACTGTILSSGKIARVGVQLQYDSAASTVADVPDFHLTGLVYKLYAFNNTWCRGFQTPDHYGSRKQALLIRRIRLADIRIPNERMLEITLADHERGVEGYIVIDQAPGSSFRGYNITRSFGIDVEITFICGGKKMTAEFAWEGVEILFSEDFHFDSRGQLPGGSLGDAILLRGAVLSTPDSRLGALPPPPPPPLVAAVSPPPPYEAVT